MTNADVLHGLDGISNDTNCPSEANVQNGVRAEASGGASVRAIYSDPNSPCDPRNLDGVMSRRHDDSMGRPRPSLGPNLRRLRAVAGLSQRALADVSGVARASIARLESGVQTSAELDTIEALASALGVTAAELVADEEATPVFEPAQSVIDRFIEEERRRPVVNPTAEEIAWLRGLSGGFWMDCPPNLETLEHLVLAHRRSRRHASED